MSLARLTNLSPLDGRYAAKTEKLGTFFSEGALIHYRVRIEVEWFIFLCNELKLAGTRKLKKDEITLLRKIYLFFSLENAEKIKQIEKTTNHDVKAVEYFIKQHLEKTKLKDLQEFVHFACTSEDINNLSYSLMLKEGIAEAVLPQLLELNNKIGQLAGKFKNTAMLARTHGQPASPTTMGKEFAIFHARIERQINNPSGIDFLGKLNGASGNFNAHQIAYPKIDWPEASYEFVSSFGLTPAMITSQIEPHDFFSEIFSTFQRINTILLDLSRDIWTYISLDYFSQKTLATEVGSSTMPHKVNPIDFENAEGNLGIANALFIHFAEKLPISRLQRDLSDSTVQRNIGVAFGHSILAYESLMKGIDKLKINQTKLNQDLLDHPEVLTEAIQTVLRRYNQTGAYEKLKNISRGKKITLKSLRAFIDKLELPKSEQERLKKLTPQTYTGLAAKLVELHLKNL